MACDSFDKDQAAMEIRDEVCSGWPYGCTDSTQVEVKKVHKTRHGRAVEFQVVDRLDETATLSGAYFEQTGEEEEWEFLLFENPFNDAFKAQATIVEQQSRRFSDELRELKSSQNWFNTIYGRYARSLQELDSVSYKMPDIQINMAVANNDSSWVAEIATRYVKCVLDISRQQLPSCVGLPADNAGTTSGPLSEAFGGER
jgi:hypothetical protein